MDSGHGKKRKRMSDNTERDVDVDRLSSLPNDLIHKILSFIGIEETVRTIAWSSRYRFIWTTMPYLNFSAYDFPKLPKFSKFVTQFLKCRDSRIDVSSLKLRFFGMVTQPPYVKKLMDYAFSHNVQQLDVDCFYPKKDTEFPLSLFGSDSQSLKHLSLGSYICGGLKATSTLELPVLTTLKIRNVTFCSVDHTDNCAGLLSKCANLKNLTLESCETVGLSSFSICHPGLANLTIERGLSGVKVVNVVAPQLENLTIVCYVNGREHVISAPNLASLAYSGYYPLRLSTDGFHCLKEADICVFCPNDTDASQMVCLLQQLYNVKFLTLNLKIIEFLSSSMELISHQPSPFVNLKSLTVYPKKHEWDMWGLPKGKVNLSTELKSYLLDSSPGATFTMFSREISKTIMASIKRKLDPHVKFQPKVYQLLSSSGKPQSGDIFSFITIVFNPVIFNVMHKGGYMDITAVKDIQSTRKLMAELRVFLEQEKANTETKGKAPMESDNAKMHKKRKAQPDMKMQLQIRGNRELIKSYWKDLSVQFEQRKAKAYLIISMLERIEGLLKKLPATNYAMIQPCFSRLCAEADTVMSKLMMMQCDENQSRLSVRFHELATSTTTEPSS